MEMYLVHLEQVNKKIVPLDNLRNCNCKLCQKSHFMSDLTSTGDHQKLK